MGEGLESPANVDKLVEVEKVSQEWMWSNYSLIAHLSGPKGQRTELPQELLDDKNEGVRPAAESLSDADVRKESSELLEVENVSESHDLSLLDPGVGRKRERSSGSLKDILGVCLESKSIVSMIVTYNLESREVYWLPTIIRSRLFTISITAIFYLF